MLSNRLLATITLLFTFTTGIAIAETNPYPTQIRPGFMTGNSDVGTDGFIDVLIPITGDDSSLFFFNPNFRFDDNGGNEQNIGFGYRLLSSCGHFIIGGNAYYDIMKSENDNRYQQWGVGAELLSQWVDLRANYYNVFGDTENNLGGSSPGTGYYFSGNSLLTSGGSNIEEALDGYDAELSVLVPGLSDFMETRLAATYYHYDANYGKDPDGWRGRIEARPVQALNLSVEYRDDDLRGTDTFLGGYLELPFSIEKLLAGNNPFENSGGLWSFGKGVREFNQRMTDKVVRDRHIVAVSHQTSSGGAGQAVVDDEMIFVNQDNEEAGDGSYENPYKSLESVPNDERFVPGAWIYVFSSDDTADTYDGTLEYEGTSEFTLLDDMVFWGQGYEHPVYGLGGGDNPILEGNGGDNILHLANNNEVMGFTIQNGWNGISGSGGKTLGANIHDNIIRNNGRTGIFIANNLAPADVNGNNLSYQFANNQIVDNGGDGIYLHHNYSDVGAFENLSIANVFSENTVLRNAGNGIDTLSDLRPSGAVTGVEIVNTFSDNEISSNDGHGITAMQNRLGTGAGHTNSGFTDTYTRNTIEQNGLNGIDLGCDIYGGTNTWMHYSFTDNVIDSNGSSGSGSSDTNGIYIYNDPSNDPLIDKSIFMQGNTITNNTNDGVRLYFLAESTDDFAGDFGGGSLSSTGGNTFADNGNYDIYRGNDRGVDIWALNNSWTDDDNPEDSIYDKQDTGNPIDSDIITAPPGENTGGGGQI